MIPGDDEVRVTCDDAVMLITLDRPRANAIDLATSRKLGEAFVYFRDNPELKVAIITGAGEKIFCAGWDLKALDSGDTPLENWWEAEDPELGGFAGITEMWNLNKPVIAALNGLTIGGGFSWIWEGNLPVKETSGVNGKYSRVSISVLSFYARWH